jgi:WD40 repeat protein
MQIIRFGQRMTYSEPGDWLRIVTASADKTARIWDTHLQTTSVRNLLAEACARLNGLTKLTRERCASPATPTACP